MHSSEWIRMEYWTDEQQFRRAAERAVADRVQWVCSKEVGEGDGLAWGGTVHTYETAVGKKVYAWGDATHEPWQIVAVRNVGAIDSVHVAVQDWLNSVRRSTKP